MCRGKIVYLPPHCMNVDQALAQLIEVEENCQGGGGAQPRR